MIEDVHLQIDSFYFPVDLSVIINAPVKNTHLQISAILRHPFLFTTIAVINCRNGVDKLSFGNMTLEFSV